MHLKEKSAYGRLRVLTAPPTSVHDIGNSTGAGPVTSPRDMEGFLFDLKGSETTSGNVSRRNASGSTGPGTSRRSNLRTSSGGSTQRLCSVNRDHSLTQFAQIDDENISALQQARIIFKINITKYKIELKYKFYLCTGYKGWCSFNACISMEKSVR